MNSTKKWLQIILSVGAVYHIVLSLLAILLKSHTPELARTFFSFNLTPTPEVMWILNPFAAYMFAFGLMLAVAASDPIRFKPIVFVAIALFALRVIQRAIFLVAGDETLKALSSPAHSVVHLVVVTIMCVVMVALALRLKKSSI